jgi:hypothetical protein
MGWTGSALACQAPPYRRERNEMFGKSKKLEAIEARLADLDVSIRELSETVSAVATKPRGGELLRYLGVAPDRFLERYFEGTPYEAYYAALNGGTESLRGRPEILGMESGVCRQLHFSTDEFRYWMGALGDVPGMHRKQWEYFYVAQVLFERGMLAPGKKGLGFAVGREALPALFAKWGCEILATDLAEDAAIAEGWVQTGQHSSQIDHLFYGNVCPRETFFAAVRYENLNMNAIPAALSGQFDFCWSSCAFEHLGSIEHGLAFVERSIDTLVPGGVAVHTTEFNLSSNEDTLESPITSIFRRRDMEELATRLTAAGHEVSPFDWSTGPGFAETVIDLPPYKRSPHLKLQIEQYVCTSIGIIVRKKLA